jgi:hypothetical protein
MAGNKGRAIKRTPDHFKTKGVRRYGTKIVVRIKA